MAITKSLLRVLIILMPLLSKGQGIKWVKGLSWEQIKQKAKDENKYIFLDCYTTWCPPCKKMDEVIYPDKAVGNYFNEKFISVKVQMDKSKNDGDTVKNWYNDAIEIAKQYRVDAYPTLLFISPEGTTSEKETGFKEIAQFLTLAREALRPGKVYSDPYAEYDQLVKEYNSGRKHYEKMVGMIQVAEKRKENEFANQLLKEYTEYAAKLPKDIRYTKEAIKLWSSREITSSDKQFQFFYKDGELIDKMREWEGSSNDIVENVMLKEVIHPFFKKQPGGDKMIQQGYGIMMVDAYGQPIRQKEPPPDLQEANWKALEKGLRNKFNKQWTIRGVINAKMIWYKGHHNWVAFAKTYVHKLNAYGVDPWINNNAFDIFLRVDDKNLLNQLIPWVEKSIAKYSGGSAEIDTYANLLYKAGRFSEAISWERKAADLAGEHNAYFLMIVEKMRKGESTWD